ncbi:transcription termination/antitermination NusG family protein [Cereibacter sphaeroides]|uniref:transcription termination/antitermination NusG family protein n=1 Tax=Cereibacter sphaeroides TaxID=1063 RepID=UPI001F1EC758|nr:transcription termination/antitermination NusG family protein [Cereibacter sphaeroides]MCE6967493.1 hypothetical protein [Cereibacter sphaeroides]
MTVPTSDSVDTWILVQVRTGQLERARKELANQGFELFCPMLRKGGGKGPLAPLLKSYAFVHAGAASAPLRQVASTFGIQSVVGPAPTRPSKVPASLVEALRSRCDGDGVFRFGNAATDDPAALLTDTESLSSEERAFLLIRSL